jgi:molybdenum cofactor cytidylyltransferase
VRIVVAGRADTAGDCEALMRLLGDMPGVDASLIDDVSSAWKRQRPWAAVTSHEDDLAHPFVLSAAAFPSLRGLHGDGAVWEVVDRHPERVQKLPLSRPLPRDVDTWDDYREVAAALGEGSTP